MIVQLAPIRSTDLKVGDTLQHRNGSRVTLTMRGLDRWEPGWRYFFYRRDTGPHTGYITDVDIDRTGPDRHWWLDQANDR